MTKWNKKLFLILDLRKIFNLINKSRTDLLGNVGKKTLRILISEKKVVYWKNMRKSARIAIPKCYASFRSYKYGSPFKWQSFDEQNN